VYPPEEMAMSKGFVVLALAIAGCGGELDGSGIGDPVQEVTSSVVFNGHDYIFVQTGRSWDQARGVCADYYGGHLASIGNATENQFVAGQIVQHGGGAWWTGYDDINTEGLWVWSDGTSPGYVNWAEQRPALVRAVRRQLDRAVGGDDRDLRAARRHPP